MTTPLSGVIYRPPNLKSMFIHYEDTKNNAKCRNLGGCGWLGVTKVISNITI